MIKTLLHEIFIKDLSLVILIVPVPLLQASLILISCRPSWKNCCRNQLDKKNLKTILENFFSEQASLITTLVMQASLITTLMVQASLIRMGFPSHAGRVEGGGGLGMCLCHADTAESQKISVSGYICPQCQARSGQILQPNTVHFFRLNKQVCTLVQVVPVQYVVIPFKITFKLHP